MTRREANKLMVQSSIGLLASPLLSSLNFDSIRKRKIPSTGQLLPVIGLGTWISFDIGNDKRDRDQLSEVLLNMKRKGGQVIDSSPMYGNSEQVVGNLTTELKIQDNFFYATKVWTTGRESGIEQMKTSMKKMNRKTMDLMQIHNLLDWNTHVKTLRNWKEKGIIKYWGITHYTNSSHDTLSRIIKNEKPDFVQFNYSIGNRNAENGLLTAALENDTAVIINRPYMGGSLFKIVKGKSLPKWSKEYDIDSWGQYFLKFIISHEAVNCAIPGTSKPHHLVDNMMAGYGKLPDKKGREKMHKYFKSI